MLPAENKPAEAELKLRECLTIREKIQPDDWTTFDTKSMLGEALVDQKKFAEAEPLLAVGLRGHETTRRHDPAAGQTSSHKALERLVKLYEAWGKHDEAMKWRKKLAGNRADSSRTPLTLASRAAAPLIPSAYIVIRTNGESGR